MSFTQREFDRFVTEARSSIERARAAAATFWWNRGKTNGYQCGKRDAEVILAGQADTSSDVQSALIALEKFSV